MVRPMPDDKLFALESYNYDLPESLIAQAPEARRDFSRLLALDCGADRISHQRFVDIVDYFAPGDVLVVNDTRVFPARLLGHKESGGRVELLLLGYPQSQELPGGSLADGWQAVEVQGLVRSSKRSRPGAVLGFGPDLIAVVLENSEGGKTRLSLRYRDDLDRLLEEHGRLPLPPYIRRQGPQQAGDRERYQTVYANRPGAVAAPTAGLHFTPELLERLRQKGVEIVHITLHVGYGTFAPVREGDIRNHRIHAEYVTVSREAAAAINRARKAGHAIWPVGTTTVRSLEFAAAVNGEVHAVADWCALYIYPGYRFKVVERLITNFHLPQSSLLFLVSALAGRERIMAAYNEAIRARYRFFSYGDAMVIMNPGGPDQRAE